MFGMHKFDHGGERQLRQLLMDGCGVTIDEFMSRFLFAFCQSRTFYGYLALIDFLDMEGPSADFQLFLMTLFL